MVVLIVCCNAAAADALARSIVANGHDVVTARSGQRALDILKCNSTIHTVVVDRLIPDMSQADLLQAYKAYRTMQWPGCEASRGTPLFLFSHPSQSEDQFHGEVLDIIAGRLSQNVLNQPFQIV